MSKHTNKKGSLAARFEKLDAIKDTARLEKYASWTLPSVFPPKNTQHEELQGGVDSTGARAVNHLANKLILTLFRPNQPFIRLQVRNDSLDNLRKVSEGTAPEAEQAKEVLNALDQELLDKEKEAMQELDYNRYRTEAITSAKNLIITGNSMMYHPPDGGKVQVYSVRDYVIVRDLSGTVIEIITRDMKSFMTFNDEVQDKLRSGKMDKFEDGTETVTLYTQLKLDSDKKYHMKQAANAVELDSEGTWSPNDLPWIPLTWNLIRGEDYGRGLVEDYAGAFHALNVLTSAQVDIAALASDVKWLVEPASVLNVQEMNRSKSGSYHQGRKDDVNAIQLGKIQDMAIIQSSIETYTRQLSQAFLLNSSVTRDAERVTAEEIRYIARELELSYGGIYSRFAEEWQLPTARLVLRKVGMRVGAGKDIYPQIITGLESLSRSGDMENLHQLLNDLAALQQVPEEFRAAIEPRDYLIYAASRRGVEYTSFTKSEAKVAAEQQAATDAQNAALQAQTQADVAVEAGKQAVQTGAA